MSEIVDSSAIRVVIVDDQELFRAGIRGMVNAESDMSVVGQAADGVEAVRLVQELSPDIVLMDLRMPEMDGVTATQEILNPARLARYANPVRVIVLTTFDLDHQAADAIRFGASGYLLKDCTPQALCDSIRAVYEGAAVLSPTQLTNLVGMAGIAQRETPVEYHDLSEREREVMKGIVEGLSNLEIAERIFAAESTVKSHVGAILRKLGLRDRIQIVVYAYRHGIQPES